VKTSPFVTATVAFFVLALAGCTKQSSEAAGKTPPAPAAAAPAEKPIAVDQKMIDATNQLEKEAEKAAAAQKKGAADVAKDVLPKTLRFSGIPNQNTTEMNARYKPLADYLTAKMGVPFEYVPSVDYAASVDAFKNGDLALCWFGGYTGVQARAAVPGARAIACGARDTKFKSYFIANKSLGLKKSDAFPMELKGKKFTFGSPQSTSGRLMPEYFIRKETKMSPKEFFGAEQAFTKGHDQTMELVAAGTFEAGCVDYTVYDKRVAEKKVDPEVVQVIWTSPEFYDYQFTAHPSLEKTYGPGFTDKLQTVLTSIRGEDLKNLAGMDRDKDGLIACKNEDFETLRKLAVEIGLLR
jgi:phosphonate transport system substrate-binding protein